MGRVVEQKANTCTGKVIIELIQFTADCEIVVAVCDLLGSDLIL